jgi:hypothetical protein
LAVTFVPGIAQAQAPGLGERAAQFPVAIYSRLFREVVNLDARADRLAARGESDAAVRHHHKLWLGLTPEQEAELKQAAADWTRQNAPLETQAGYARAILRRLRQESPKAAVAAQEQGLAAITAQQIALTQSARSSLANTFGPAQFAYFESTLRRYAVSEAAVPLRPMENCDQVCPLPTGEKSYLIPGVPPPNGYLGGVFSAQLAPNDVNFNGLQVYESFPDTNNDECFARYPLAGLPEVTQLSAGNPWTVGGASSGFNPAPDYYGADAVALSPDFENLYAEAMAQDPDSTGFCTISGQQHMSITDTCSGDGLYEYDVHSIVFTISGPPNNTNTCAQRGDGANAAYGCGN